MTKLLSTGEMIDKLKVGEVAECIGIPEYETLSRKQRQVEINNFGNLEWGDKIEFIVTDFVRGEARWIILPNYVSFKEAINAFFEGKEINYHGENKKNATTFRDDGTGFMVTKEFGELINSKWTIEGDAE